jgi:adenosine deaminase CECR1
LRSGIPITINPDDPGMMGYTFSYDFYEAFMAWDLDLSDLKKLAINSLKYSSLNAREKELAVRSWKIKWDRFIT